MNNVFAVFMAATQRVKKSDPKSLPLLLRALKNREDALLCLQSGDYAEAVRLDEIGLAAIQSVSEVDDVKALIRGGMVSTYLGMGQLKKAAQVGEEALIGLKDDIRLVSDYARCLTDLGGVYIELGRFEDGIHCLTHAQPILDRMPDQAQAAQVCRHNLAVAQSRMSEARPPSTKRQWWRVWK